MTFILATHYAQKLRTSELVRVCFTSLISETRRGSTPTSTALPSLGVQPTGEGRPKRGLFKTAVKYVWDKLVTLELITFLIGPCAGTLLYIFSRLYIVVESFVSLRRVPIGVYETVTWAQYIPHF